MKSITIDLKTSDIKKAQEFAEARAELSLNHYKRRGQGSLDKIKYDITIGALGEIAAHRLLKELGIKADKPDFNVYDTRNKSYDADLQDNQGNRYHCKSQSIESKEQYGASYILQYGGNGTGHTDKLFRSRTNRDFLIPCLVNIDEKEVTIYGVIKIDTIFKKDLIKMPRVKWLEYSKRAIYLEDLYTLTYYERWGRLKKCLVVE